MTRSAWVCAVVMGVVLAGCGGGSDDGSSDPQTTTPTITVGSTVVAAGESKTITAAVGDTLTINASQQSSQLVISKPASQECVTLWPNGIRTSGDTFTVKIGATSTECIFKVTFDEGVAELVVQVQ